MYTSKSGPGWWEQVVFEQLAKYLSSRGFQVTIKKVDSFKLKYHSIFKNGEKTIKFKSHFSIIQDNNTGDFYVLDCFDRLAALGSLSPKSFVRDPRCKIFLKCQYRKKFFAKYPLTKVKPWTYFEDDSLKMQSYLEELRKIKRKHKLLYFRGALSWLGFRRGPIIKKLKKRGIINLDTDKIDYYPYLKESCRYKILLSLPGGGNLCHREIEGFGAGTPVLMPLLKNSLYNDLIPNYHYISVDADPMKSRGKHVAYKIEERFLEVIEDQEYLNFIAENAKQWYDTNVRFPNSLELTAKLLGIVSEYKM